VTDDHPDRWGTLLAGQLRLAVERPPQPRVRPRLVVGIDGSTSHTVALFTSDPAADLFMDWLREVRPLVARARTLREIPGLFVIPDMTQPNGVWLHQQQVGNITTPPTPWAVPALFAAMPDAEQISPPPTQEGHDDDHHT
jgi:hypothetical protein